MTAFPSGRRSLLYTGQKQTSPCGKVCFFLFFFERKKIFEHNDRRVAYNVIKTYIYIELFGKVSYEHSASERIKSGFKQIVFDSEVAVSEN